jgi:hypothetical protein
MTSFPNIAAPDKQIVLSLGRGLSVLGKYMQSFLDRQIESTRALLVLQTLSRLGLGGGGPPRHNFHDCGPRPDRRFPSPASEVDRGGNPRMLMSAGLLPFFGSTGSSSGFTGGIHARVCLGLTSLSEIISDVGTSVL